jgi:Glycosyltransferase (GlcNAc)
MSAAVAVLVAGERLFPALPYSFTVQAQQLTHCFPICITCIRDEKYILEVKASSSYPKAVLSSYPPGFPNKDTVPESPGARLCTCSTRLDDPNPIIRINTGVGYSSNLPPRPTQIPFIAGTTWSFIYYSFHWTIAAARLVWHSPLFVLFSLLLQLASSLHVRNFLLTFPLIPSCHGTLFSSFTCESTIATATCSSETTRQHAHDAAFLFDSIYTNKHTYTHTHTHTLVHDRLFMGEEIALSMRAWTHGWNIYAPRKNLIGHQYRPGRMGLPKFWESVNRLYKPGSGNNQLQSIVIARVKHMVGYPDASLEKIREKDTEFVLQDIEHYGLGSERSWQDYMDFAHMSIDQEHDVIVCSRNDWCNQGLKD